MLVANQARVPFRGPPPELTFAAGDKAPKRLFAIPPTTILSLQYPSGGAPRYWCPDVFAHQARESSPILARSQCPSFQKTVRSTRLKMVAV